MRSTVSSRGRCNRTLFYQLVAGQITFRRRSRSERHPAAGGRCMIRNLISSRRAFVSAAEHSVSLIDLGHAAHGERGPSPGWRQPRPMQEGDRSGDNRSTMTLSIRKLVYKLPAVTRPRSAVVSFRALELQERGDLSTVRTRPGVAPDDPSRTNLLVCGRGTRQSKGSMSIGRRSRSIGAAASVRTRG
jgi:hypothetical protein